MLSLTREGPYLIFGNNGKCQTCSSNFAPFICTATQPSFLINDDTLTHAANDMKRTFLIVGSKILHGRSWIYFDIEFCTLSPLKRCVQSLHLDWWYFRHCGNDVWRIYTDFCLKIWQVKVKLRVKIVSTGRFVSLG